ncbi:MAG: hypothetical protein ACI9T7_001800 [Oleiphilaceae bacterium]|jgi:hypothetical protein
MNNKQNFKGKLLFGNSLRDLLNDSNVTNTVLRKITRRRGIFIYKNEKPDHIQALVSTGITPIELTEIIDSIITKEENPKYQSQIIRCNDNNLSLINSVPIDFNLRNIAQEDFSNYQIIGVPNFKAVGDGKDHIELDFSIERFQMTNSSYKNISEFQGKIIIKKENGEVDIKATTSHSSPETKEIAKKVVDYFVNELKKSGVINIKENLIKVRFSDFTNENRISFIKELSQKSNGEKTLYFKDTKDISFKPEPGSVLPDEISWMQENISNLALQGKNLHSTFFFDNVNFYKHIQLYRVVAYYQLDHLDFKGSCQVNFDFHGFLSKEDPHAELILSVTNLKLNDNGNTDIRSLSKNKIIQVILSEIEMYKYTFFEKYRKCE